MGNALQGVLLRALQAPAEKTALEIKSEEIGLPSTREGYSKIRKEIRKRMACAAVPDQRGELIICGSVRSQALIHEVKEKDPRWIPIEEVLQIVTSDYDGMQPHMILDKARSQDVREAQRICYLLLRDVLKKTNEQVATALKKHRNVVSNGYWALCKKSAVESYLKTRITGYTKILLGLGE